MKRFIYADNAATTRLDPDAFEKMRPFLLDSYGNASQPYSFSRRSREALSEARETIASCINALPEEIYFTSGGTESDNWALKQIDAGEKQRVETITTAIEHHAVLNSCVSLESQGDPVIYMPVSGQGVVCLDTLSDSLSERTRLVSVMMANNEIGSIQPIKELCRLSHQYGGYFHTDAVQAVGHIQVDVRELDVDMLSASGHKFNGPKGVGFLYVKRGTRLKPFMNGGGQEKGFRAGTENVAGIIGMAEALRRNCSRMSEQAEKLGALEKALLSELRSENIDFIRNGSEEHISGNVSLSFRGCEGEMLLHRLDLMGICVSTGSACDSQNTQISHVLKAIQVPEDYAAGTIRISFGAENSSDDGIMIARAIGKIIG